MEKQDAAVPFRVRLDVAAGRAGGDAFALTVVDINTRVPHHYHDRPDLG